MIAHDNNSERLTVLRNQQWSISSLAKASDGLIVELYSYDVFGKRTILAANGTTVRTTSSYNNPYGYTSRRHDEESGLMYYRARYYDPETSEFVSQDPMEYVDGASVYRGYFLIRGIDPFGLLSLSSETEATWPENRERTTVGVGEYIVITAEGTLGCEVVSWRSWGDAVNHRFTHPTDKDETIRWFAGEREGTVRITVADDCGCEATINFTVIEPSGVRIRRVNKRVRHTNGLPSAGFLGQPKILPTTVSFGGIEVREQVAEGVGTGIFSVLNGDQHPLGKWNPVNDDNDTSRPDRIFSGEISDFNFTAGTFTWAIPWEFRVGRGGAKRFTTVNHVATVTETGQMTMSKGGASVSAEINDPSSGY